MKKLILTLCMGLIVLGAWSQNPRIPRNRDFRIPLIGDKAPSFTAESTQGTINFPSDFGKSWKILFYHPMDFTPVCTTEIMELAQDQDQFARKNVRLIVISTDSLFRHKQWVQSMEGIRLNGREPARINFPLVADPSLVVSKEYGMIHPESDNTKDVRGVYVIDPDNSIAGIFFYPMHVGRNTDELLRFVEALQATTADNISTPVNWQPGQDYLVMYNPGDDPAHPGNLPPGYYKQAWYLYYKKAGMK
jgi:peroxiredoxin (alkyl hydroperoxide reductase subunit C)